MSEERFTGVHPDLDRLADHQAGLVEVAEAAAIDAHLEVCRTCAARRDDLAGLPAVLAAAAVTGPVPADVRDRLDAALRAERSEAATAAVHPTAATDPATHARAATVTPLVPRDRSPWSSRVLQAAAVLVLLLGGVGVVLSGLTAGGGGEDAGGSADTAGSAVQESAPEAFGGYPVTASGRNWSPATLPEEVPALVAGTLGPPVAADAEGGATTRELAENPAARLVEGPALATCVANLAGGPVTPLSVDVAAWEGDPAAVVVLPAPEDPTRVDVYVVAPDCAEGTFLFYAGAPRP